MTPSTRAGDETPDWQRRLCDDSESMIPLTPARRPEGDVAAWAEGHAGGEPPKSGILNIDKPAGRTSHDVVQAVRRAAEARRVGHAGTLDPMATGVLVVCLGSATRVVTEIQDGWKSYHARVRLGVETTTYDAEGEIVATTDPTGITRAAAAAALERFRGEIDQVPPMYSALKHDGERLYRLARKGIEVQREPRSVTVHDLDLTHWEPPDVELAMVVSKGTYVRSLAHDLGAALGVGAHLAALRRTAVGRFTVDEATPLDTVLESFADGWWPRLMYPLDTALLDYRAVIVSDDAEAAIRQGQQTDAAPPAPAGGAVHDHEAEREPVRAYNRDGHFIGLLRWDNVTCRWQPDRVFPAPGRARAS
ncbi:MAG: tRNA pseudouridine(55) synthase TruB [Anaerolineae bacterium]